MEIVWCGGNVSIKDKEPFAHLHAALGGTDLRMYGGHLFPGCAVFAAEIAVTELTGGSRVRKLDRATGLPLWPMPAPRRRK